MARLKVLFQCVGQAVCARGLRALAGAVPFGEVLYDIAEDAFARLRRHHRDDELLTCLQEAARTPCREVEEVAAEAARVAASAQPEPVRQALTVYLSQMPAAVRQSLRRPIDPSGTTVPPDLVLRKPADLLPLLPLRLPRFRAGERPPGVGDWELEELLGVGGFGEVWKARNPHLVEPVALKFCLDPTAARVLRNEATLLGQIMSQGHYPGIVRLLHTYLNAPTPCLEYEYVPGGDLTGLIGNWHRSPPDSLGVQAMRLVRRLAVIVGFAHRLNPPVVHRDLKPANILLRRRAEGRVSLQIADFGIGGVAARQAAEQARQGTSRVLLLATSLRGACTPLYASPQQLRGEGPDPRDDVYALGVIWFQVLTGDLTAGASADWRDEVVGRGLSDATLKLLGSCMAAKADKRPADGGALAAELDKLLQSPPKPDVRPGPRDQVAQPNCAPASPATWRSGTGVPAGGGLHRDQLRGNLLGRGQLPVRRGGGSA